MVEASTYKTTVLVLEGREMVTPILDNKKTNSVEKSDANISTVINVVIRVLNVIILVIILCVECACRVSGTCWDSLGF